MKIATNFSLSHAVSKSMSVLHTILVKQMVDREAHRARSNYSSRWKITKAKLDEEHSYFFPSYDSPNDTSLYPPNGSWNNTGVFLENSNVDYNSIMIVNPCHLISTEEVESHQNIAFYLEIVVQPIFVFIGLAFNTIAINVLRR